MAFVHVLARIAISNPTPSGVEDRVLKRVHIGICRKPTSVQMEVD